MKRKRNAGTAIPDYFIHMQNACDLFGQRSIPIIWGPLRQGPGHNMATYHRNHDD